MYKVSRYPDFNSIDVLHALNAQMQSRYENLGVELSPRISIGVSFTLSCKLPVYHLGQDCSQGDCYVAATGLIEKDEDGFMQIAPYYDGKHNAMCMLEFAEGALSCKHCKNAND